MIDLHTTLSSNRRYSHIVLEVANFTVLWHEKTSPLTHFRVKFASSVSRELAYADKHDVLIQS